MRKSIIVIGGGLGGLFSGALLAKYGCRVTVLEKNSTIGGGLQTFGRNGVRFDTGMHIMGGWNIGQSLNKICRFLGVIEKLNIRNTDLDCMDEIHYESDHHTYRIASSREGFINSLIREFPQESDGIRRYVDHIYSIAEKIDLFWLRPTESFSLAFNDSFLEPADSMISRFVKDERLRDVLGYLNPLYSGIKGHTPSYVHSLINVLYINGSSRFIDGSQQLATVLSEVIMSAGGCVRVNSEVSSIRTTEKKIESVHTKDGREYHADIYVSAIHPQLLVGLLPEKSFSSAYVSRVLSVPQSYSSFSLFISFKPKTFPYINHTCYFQKDYGDVWDYSKYDEANWPNGFMYMTAPCSNQTDYARTMTINAIMPFSPVERWCNTKVGKRGDEYYAWKEVQKNKLLEKMEILYPGFKEMIEQVYSSSPLTIRDYFGNPKGSLYGNQKDCMNIPLSQMSVMTKISNLFLTGQNIYLHGICGVPLTAVTTVEAILGQNRVINDINNSY